MKSSIIFCTFSYVLLACAAVTPPAEQVKPAPPTTTHHNEYEGLTDEDGTDVKIIVLVNVDNMDHTAAFPSLQSANGWCIHHRLSCKAVVIHLPK